MSPIKKSIIRWQLQPIYKRSGQIVVKDERGQPCRVGMRLRASQTVWFGSAPRTVTVSKEIPSTAERAVAEAKRLLKADLHLAVCALADRGLGEEVGALSSEITHKLDKATDVLSQAGGAMDALTEDLIDLSRGTTLTVACLRYLQDNDEVDASPDTRRIYESYLRNHIAVPTAAGRSALGDLPIREIGKDVVRAWERSLYEDRHGYRMCEYAYAFEEREGAVASPEAILKGACVTMEAKRQVRLGPRTAQKIVVFLAGVVNYAEANLSSWSGVRNPFYKYKMKGEVYKPRKTAVVRKEAFDLLVQTAEANPDLRFMIPFMAFVACAFRPAEARGLRWSDIAPRATEHGLRWRVVVSGTIQPRPGGERWVGGAKTKAAEEEYVLLPKHISDLLERHCDRSAEYVCPPSPGGELPFLSRTAYENGWQKLLSLAGLGGLSPYSLKHGTITTLLKKKYTPEMVATMTRHTTTEMIVKIYNGMLAEDLVEAMDQIDREARAEKVTKQEPEESE